MRSVADSNRRTRFCRPLPNHSANRPLYGFSRFGWAKITKNKSKLQGKNDDEVKNTAKDVGCRIRSLPEQFLPYFLKPIAPAPRSD